MTSFLSGGQIYRCKQLEMGVTVEYRWECPFLFTGVVICISPKELPEGYLLGISLLTYHHLRQNVLRFIKQRPMPDNSKMLELKNGPSHPLTNFLILKTKTPRPKELKVPDLSSQFFLLY